MARRGALLLASLAGLLVVTGCSSGTGGTNATGSTAASPTKQPPVSASKTVEASGSAAPAASVDRPCTGEQHPAGWDHVVWIVMENRGSQTMASNRKAPYFNQLADAIPGASLQFLRGLHFIEATFMRRPSRVLPPAVPSGTALH